MVDVLLKGYNRIDQIGTNVSNNKFPRHVSEDVIHKHPEDGGVFKVLMHSTENNLPLIIVMNS